MLIIKHPNTTATFLFVASISACGIFITHLLDTGEPTSQHRGEAVEQTSFAASHPGQRRKGVDPSAEEQIRCGPPGQPAFCLLP